MDKPQAVYGGTGEGVMVVVPGLASERSVNQNTLVERSSVLKRQLVFLRRHPLRPVGCEMGTVWVSRFVDDLLLTTATAQPPP